MARKKRGRPPAEEQRKPFAIHLLDSEKAALLKQARAQGFEELAPWCRAVLLDFAKYNRWPIGNESRMPAFQVGETDD